jgi:hypothetical protein
MHPPHPHTPRLVAGTLCFSARSTIRYGSNLSSRFAAAAPAFGTESDAAIGAT